MRVAHLRFTFGQAPKIRESYAMQARQVGDFVAVIQRHTRPGQSVMVWPTDCAPGAYGVPVYGALYYARRATPLEMSNSDVIFKRKINRLSPPMPELLTRLRAHAPDVIIDWSPVAVELAPPDHPEAGPQLLPTVAGFSLLEEPNEQHAFLEGRTLAPLKQWLRANYGGQELDNGCVVFYRGRPWRQWQEFILPK